MCLSDIVNTTEKQHQVQVFAATGFQIKRNLRRPNAIVHVRHAAPAVQHMVAQLEESNDETHLIGEFETDRSVVVVIVLENGMAA